MEVEDVDRYMSFVMGLICWFCDCGCRFWWSWVVIFVIS